MKASNPLSQVRRFLRRDDGVALVEFALFVPVFVLAFFVIVEFGRTFFSYQGAVAGVRDATRYAARTLDQDICVGAANGGGAVLRIATDSSDTFYRIVEQSLLNEVDVLPTNVRLNSVTSSYRCVVEPGNFRQREVPVARIQANLEIILPLGEVLVLNNQPVLNNIVTDIDEESRIFGL